MSPPRVAAQFSRAKDIALRDAYGVRPPQVDYHANSGLDAWRKEVGTLDPTLLSASAAQLPQITNQLGEKNTNLAASLSLCCLRPPPRAASRNFMGECQDGASCRTTVVAGDSLLPPTLSRAVAEAPPKVATGVSSSANLGATLRLPPPTKEFSCGRHDQSVPSGAVSSSDKSKQTARQVPARGQRQKSCDGRRQQGQNADRDSGAPQSANSIQEELKRRRSIAIRRQMLVENQEYMDDQLSELRRGKIRLRHRMSQCSDDELFENRSFYTDYSMTIRHRSRKHESDASKNAPALGSLSRSNSSALSSSIAVAAINDQPSPVRSISFSASQSLQQPADGEARKNKRGQPVSSVIAREVRALQQQIEGSHKMLQVSPQSK